MIMMPPRRRERGEREKLQGFPHKRPSELQSTDNTHTHTDTLSLLSLSLSLSLSSRVREDGREARKLGSVAGRIAAAAAAATHPCTHAHAHRERERGPGNRFAGSVLIRTGAPLAELNEGRAERERERERELESQSEQLAQ